MKEIEVITSLVPAKGRSKNYQGLSRSVVSSVSSPSAGTSGSSDTAKVAQNLAADSTDWDKIIRKDKEDSTLYAVDFQAGLKVNGSLLKDVIKSNGSALVSDDTVFTSAKVNNLLNAQSDLFISKTKDDRTEHNLGIGQNLTVDGTGTFGGLLKAAALTITGAVFAATVSANTMTANVFNGDLNGNAATATKLKISRNILGIPFDGTSDCNGNASILGTLNVNGGSAFASGAVFYGQTTQPTNLGTYVLNYVSSTYGARITAYDGTAYKDLKIGAMPTAGVFGQTLMANGDTNIGYNIGTSNFVSHTSGWRVNPQGAADFRNIYADELRVQAFTADISQALAGSDYLTKSVSKLSANFVVPAVNSTVRIIVDDIEGMPATRCFANGDYIRFRAFNRTSGLTIANVWGTVTLDTSFGTNGFTNGTQAYTFTCKATSGTGLTVFKGAEVLDYGTSGSGMISRTTLDAQGSPYEQIATWINDPSVSTNYTVHARLGNLNGIANCNGYGLYTDNGFFTGNVVIGDLTKNNNFLSFDGVNGLQIKLGGTSVATTTDVSTAVNNVQIGGRNLARLSKGDFTYNLPDISNYTTVMCYVYWVGNKSANIVISGDVEYSNIVFTGTGTPLFSIQGLQDVGGWGEALGFPMNDKISEGNGKFHFAFATSEPSIFNNNYWSFGFRSDYITGTITLRNLKVEYGTKETSWSPAPEDIDASIASAQSSAVSTAASNAAALYVTQSTYNSYVTVTNSAIQAKVSQTDFNALGTRVGSAESTITQHSTDIASKVAQTDFNALTGRVSTAESTITQHSTDIGLRVTKDGVIGAINLTSETATIQASKINLVGAVTISAFDSSVTASALGGATPSDVSTAVNNVQIGGRNLARLSKGDFTYNLPDISNYTTVMCNAYWVGNKSANIVISGDVEYSNIVFTGTGTPLFSIQGPQDVGGWGNGLGFILNNKISEGSGKFHFVSVYLDSSILNNNYWNFGFRTDYITGTITFKNLKVEYGTKETSWTPAPEDVDNSIDTAQQTAQAAQTTASNAQTSANTANSAISDMTSDDKITAQEKQAMKTEWDSIVSEKTKNDTQADAFSVSRTTYDSAYSTLSTTIGTNLSNLTTTWDLGSGGGATLRAQFKAYYDARTDLLNAVSTKAKSLADAAQTKANTAYDNAASAQTDATAALTRNNTMAVKLGYTDYNALASSTALGQTLINGGMINTLLINATAVVTNGLTANCITANMIASGAVTADKIAASTITGDKIAANTITADKIQTNTITALGAVSAGSFNLGNGKFIVDANGKLTAAEATLSGSINATSGIVGGWNISNNALSCTGVATAHLNVEPSSNRFLRINEDETSLMHIRAEGTTGIYIYTQDAGGTCLLLTALAAGSKAIDSYGDVRLISHTTEGTTINGLCEAMVIVTTEGTIGYDSGYKFNGLYCPSLVLAYNASEMNIYMPYTTSLHDGQRVKIRKCASGNIYVRSHDSTFLHSAGYTESYHEMQYSDANIYTWCAAKGYWIVN